MEDAGDDRVAPRSVGLEDFASRAPAFENGAERHAIADFCGDFHHAQRSLVAARAIADAELGSGDRKLGEREAILDHRETLVGNADDDEGIGGKQRPGKREKCETDDGKKNLTAWHVF